jgi:hypothetical protein
MHDYIVTGTISYCVYSQWSEITISEEVEAANADAARQQVLDAHRKITEQQDPYATVQWHTPELVQVKRVTALEWQA